MNSDSVLLDPHVEYARWMPFVTCQKWWDSDDFAKGLRPDAIEERPGNLLCTAGITRMLNLLIGAGGQAFTATYARIGVGNSSTAESAAHTDLQAAAGSSNRYFRPMDSTYPQVATNVVTFQATWGSSDGNFAWNEWGIDAGGAGTSTPGTTVGAPLLNRKVPSPSLGTKTGGTWTLTVTITIA